MNCKTVCDMKFILAQLQVLPCRLLGEPNHDSNLNITQSTDYLNPEGALKTFLESVKLEKIIRTQLIRPLQINEERRKHKL